MRPLLDVLNVDRDHRRLDHLRLTEHHRAITGAAADQAGGAASQAGHEAPHRLVEFVQQAVDARERLLQLRAIASYLRAVHTTEPAGQRQGQTVLRDHPRHIAHRAGDKAAGIDRRYIEDENMVGESRGRAARRVRYDERRRAALPSPSQRRSRG